MELIKINKDHYIIVDDSKIEDNDWMQRNDEDPVQAVPNFWWDFRDRYRKVTHSTKPLEDITVLVRPDGSDVSKTIFDKVKEISLSEVKKLIGEELKYHQRLWKVLQMVTLRLLKIIKVRISNIQRKI